MQKLKKCLLTFGMNRWSKCRAFIKKFNKNLSLRSDVEFRCYSNYFLISLASYLSEYESLQQLVIDMIETNDKDVKLIASPSDFADNFNKLAEKWAKRLNLLKVITHLVRQYKASQKKFNQIPYQVQDPKIQKLYSQNLNILNYIP